MTRQEEAGLPLSDPGYEVGSVALPAEHQVINADGLKELQQNPSGLRLVPRRIVGLGPYERPGQIHEPISHLGGSH